MRTFLIQALAGLAAATCYKGVHVFSARGTFEPQNASLTDVPAQGIVDKIPDSALTHIVYPANGMLPESSNIGAVNMSQAIRDYYAECPSSKTVLMGYSQGALVLGNVLNGGGIQGVEPLPQNVGKNVVGIIQYGDPERQYPEPYDQDSCNLPSAAPRQGDYATVFDSYSKVILSFCNIQDPICCKNGTNYVAHAQYFTTENQQQVADFVSGNFNASSQSYL